MFEGQGPLTQCLPKDWRIAGLLLVPYRQEDSIRCVRQKQAAFTIRTDGRWRWTFNQSSLTSFYQSFFSLITDSKFSAIHYQLVSMWHPNRVLQTYVVNLISQKVQNFQADSEYLGKINSKKKIQIFLSMFSFA